MGNPPTEWSETKNIKWKVAIPGRGSASPIIWGDKIFILTAIKTDRTAPGAEAAASARNSQSGRLLIRRASCWPSVRKIAMARAEATDVVVAATVAVVAADLAAGGGFGGGESPTNYHQFVVMCLDRNTGETIWSHTAADVIPHEGHHQTGSFASASPITDGKHL